ncbi:MAG: hypothetical protein NVSMB55_10310 [Mycobacteriales bacterium]
MTVLGAVEVLHGPGQDAQWRPEYRDLCLRYQNAQEVADHLDQTKAIPRVLLALPVDWSTGVTTWRVPRPGEDSRGIWADRYRATAGD